MTSGGAGPWTPSPPTSRGDAAASTDQDPSWVTDEGFRRLVAQTIPCRSNDPELWFAERAADVERAKELCRACPLVAGCLAGARERREPWGVWGGEIFVDGVVVARKRGRGRPPKSEQSPGVTTPREAA
ncbi:WhiB family transcriptional regulator [Paraoerskovia marina]|nr:WhiB family transcriptional regulator [Paraoerskovia marina]